MDHGKSDSDDIMKCAAMMNMEIDEPTQRCIAQSTQAPTQRMKWSVVMKSCDKGVGIERKRLNAECEPSSTPTGFAKTPSSTTEHPKNRKLNTGDTPTPNEITEETGTDDYIPDEQELKCVTQVYKQEAPTSSTEFDATHSLQNSGLAGVPTKNEVAAPLVHTGEDWCGICDIVMNSVYSTTNLSVLAGRILTEDPLTSNVNTLEGASLDVVDIFMRFSHLFPQLRTAIIEVLNDNPEHLALLAARCDWYPMMVSALLRTQKNMRTKLVYRMHALASKNCAPSCLYLGYSSGILLMFPNVVSYEGNAAFIASCILQAPVAELAKIVFCVSGSSDPVTSQGAEWGLRRLVKECNHQRISDIIPVVCCLTRQKDLGRLLRTTTSTKDARMVVVLAKAIICRRKHEFCLSSSESQSRDSQTEQQTVLSQITGVFDNIPGCDNKGTGVLNAIASDWDMEHYLLYPEGSIVLNLLKKLDKMTQVNAIANKMRTGKFSTAKILAQTFGKNMFSASVCHAMHDYGSKMIPISVWKSYAECASTEAEWWPDMKTRAAFMCDNILISTLDASPENSNTQCDRVRDVFRVMATSACPKNTSPDVLLFNIAMEFLDPAAALLIRLANSLVRARDPSPSDSIFTVIEAFAPFVPTRILLCQLESIMCSESVLGEGHHDVSMTMVAVCRFICKSVSHGRVVLSVCQ